ncbi:hypothetical protein [Muricoccus pecuniae]|uniref:Transposase-like protein n=1 Tax=Muricoccus pecuniae TaxID=693023 RepID=A0A840YCS6_9PROT|nr:hypothetical protein [Roseomonas pecuniae]MBB5696489.1 transposase-like protein [Roseomonas pecuniae]
MPRIAREEHARIRERIEVGGEKVAAVAASYGCTPANIYAILSKLRQAGEVPAAPLPLILEEGQTAITAPDQQVSLQGATPSAPQAKAAVPLVEPSPPQAATSHERPALPAPARPTGDSDDVGRLFRGEVGH